MVMGPLDPAGAATGGDEDPGAFRVGQSGLSVVWDTPRPGRGGKCGCLAGWDDVRRRATMAARPGEDKQQPERQEWTDPRPIPKADQLAGKGVRHAENLRSSPGRHND